ncbi:hypothetical protein N431DRAFT_448887 [Stipitochalara longipes BDJ]|nr:hypothetical protein N431DRAFT_448887 [Stipitochalara longipes BDJ]
MAENLKVSKGQKFTLFSSLPTEIQLEIWKLTLPEPRIITVKVFAAQTMYDPDFVISNEQGQDHRFISSSLSKAGETLTLDTTNTKNPGVLFACTVSRDVSLNQLSACLDLRNGEKQKRFDPRNDTILLYNTTDRCIPILPGIPEQPNIYPDYMQLFLRSRSLLCGPRVSWAEGAKISIGFFPIFPPSKLWSSSQIIPKISIHLLR